MFVIVGLGNPGQEYENTRHNAGWISIDALAESLNANYWKDECGAKVAHCKNQQYDDEVLLVKPQSFMNLSGAPVKNLREKYGFGIDDIIVIHDDMDITSGNIKIKQGGGAAGHKGLLSLTQKLQTENYKRVRIGIDRAPGNRPYADYVLEEPKGKLRDGFNIGTNLAAEAALFLLEHSIEEAQQKYNSKN